MNDRNERNEVIGIGLGILLLVGMHVAAFMIFWWGLVLISGINNRFPTPLGNYLTTGYNFLYFFIFFWLVQLIYVLPVVVLLKRRQNIGMMKGVIAGAVITALLNGGCWLSLMPR